MKKTVIKIIGIILLSILLCQTICFADEISIDIEKNHGTNSIYYKGTSSGKAVPNTSQNNGYNMQFIIGIGLIVLAVVIISCYALKYLNNGKDVNTVGSENTEAIENKDKEL